MITKAEIVKQASQLACKLHKEHGIPHRQACMMASRAILRVLGRPPGAGMGQATAALARAAELAPIKATREAVTPWLWVLSVFGFGMAILNTRRIGKMFKGWRAKQKPV